MGLHPENTFPTPDYIWITKPPFTRDVRIFSTIVSVSSFCRFTTFVRFLLLYYFSHFKRNSLPSLTLGAPGPWLSIRSGSWCATTALPKVVPILLSLTAFFQGHHSKPVPDPEIEASICPGSQYIGPQAIDSPRQVTYVAHCGATIKAPILFVPKSFFICPLEIVCVYIQNFSKYLNSRWRFHPNVLSP